MKILNLGSINMDHVYSVDHFVQPGETQATLNYQLFAGGKGLNQSIALARAGAGVFHLGKIGSDGLWLRDKLKSDGVDISFLQTTGSATGHAIIQVDRSGENAILIHGGANQEISENEITDAIGRFQPGDWLLVQNETSGVANAIAAAKSHHMKVAFNPAPMGAEVLGYPIEQVDLLILNETEAEKLTGHADPDSIREFLAEKYPATACLLTLGSRGAIYFDHEIMISEPSLKVQAVDTTAAGDTFIGYFLAELLSNASPARALKIACHAAAICVTRPGAADSIPLRSELNP